MSGIDLKGYLVKETPAEEDKSKDISSYLVKEPEPAAEAPSLLGGIGRSVLSGLVSGAGSVLSGIGYTQKNTNKAFEPIEKEFIDKRPMPLTYEAAPVSGGSGWGDADAPTVPPETPPQKTPYEDISEYLMTSGRKVQEKGADISKNVPQTLTNKTAQGVGSMIPYLLTGLATGNVSAPAAGWLARSALETMSNAGQTYQALKDKNYSDEVAMRAANRQVIPDSLINLALEPFGALSDKGRLMRMAGEAVQEGVVQEPSQNITQAAAMRSAEGSLWDFGKALWEEAKNYPQQFREVGLPAMIAGALVGGVSPGVGAQDVQQNVQQEARQETPIQPKALPQAGEAYIGPDGTLYTVTKAGTKGLALEAANGEKRGMSHAEFEQGGYRRAGAAGQLDTQAQGQDVEMLAETSPQVGDVYLGADGIRYTVTKTGENGLALEASTGKKAGMSYDAFNSSGFKRLSSDEISAGVGIPSLEGVFGPNYQEYEGKPVGAVAKLLYEKQGEVRNAIHNSEGEGIDFIYGATGKNGYGIGHIVEKHGKKIAVRLQQIVENGEKHTTPEGVVYILGTEFVVTKERWNGQDKRWVVTAYDKSNPSNFSKKVPSSYGRSTHVAQISPRNDSSSGLGGTNETLSDNSDNVNALSSTSELFFEPPMPKGERTSKQKINDVRKIIENVLGIPVREGQVRKKNTLGYIDHLHKVIRSKSKNDIATLLHEFGHAIDRKFGLSSSPLGSAVQEEFALFGKLMGYKKELWQSEGLAQFFQWRAINPELAEKQFPTYSKIFDEFLKENPDAEKMVTPVFEAAREYYYSTPESRLDAIIADRQNAGRPSVKEFLAGKMKSARRSLIDRHEIFGEINQTVASALNIGKRMLPDAVNLEAAVRTMPGVKAVIRQKVANFQKHYAGFTQDEKQALTRYMIAGDALDYLANGMNPGTGLTQEELTGIRERTPEKVKQAAEAMRAEYDQMMEDTLVHSGMITKEMLDAWKKKYPNYSPMVAIDDDGSPRLMSPREKGIVSLEQPGSTQARQSAKYDRDIQMRMDPVAAMLNNYRIFHDLAARNDVGKTLVNISKIPGLAKIVEKVPNMGNNVFWVWEDGKKHYYATDPEIYAALRTMGEAGIPDNAFYRFAHNVSEIFKAGTTRYNPWFIPKNFIRDSFTMSLQSRGKVSSLRNMPFVNTFDGIMQMLGADKTMLNEAIEDGVFYSSIVELNQDNVPKLINDNLRGGRLKETLRKLGAVADRIGEWNEVVELAPKLREYVLLRKQGIPRKQAAMEAREVNVDFQRAGTVGRVLNQYIPFLNAQLQGVDKVARTFREHPKESMLKAGIYLTLPSVLEWILYHDDEDYKALDKGIKDTHWVFRLPGAAPDDFVRVPMPFEAGVLFGGATKRALDKMFEKDPAAWMDYFTSAKEAIVPDMQVALLRPWFEVWANKDSFRDRPIVPLKEQKLPNRLQYGSSTSYPAKLAGQLFDVSPRKVDHLIRGYGGTMASQVSHVFDPLDKGKAPAPSRNWHESTLFRPYTISSDTSNLYIKRFYDVAEKLEKELTGAKAEHSVYADAALARSMSGPRQYLSRIWKRIGEVRDSQSMPPDAKAQEIDRLNKMAIKIAKSALERYDKRKK